MRKLLYLLVSAFIFSSCFAKEVKVTVKNPSDFDRKTDIVELAVENLKSRLNPTDNETYVVKNNRGETVPSQLTADGKLIFQSGLKSKETIVYKVTTGEPILFDAKTHARFFKERKDDFVWENDRVGFRFYGDTLKYSDGPSNGLDLWYKRTDKMVLDRWYDDALTRNIWFHDDRGEGCDPYAVGRSLGAGAMAPFVKGKLWLNENYKTQQIIDNGPLRSTFKLTYNSFDVDGKSVTESRTISIDAGSQYTKIIEEYGVSQNMTVAAGIVMRASNDSILYSTEKGYVIYREPSDVHQDVFLGLIFPTKLDSVVTNVYTNMHPIWKKESTFKHALGVTEYEVGKPLEYYTGFGWTKFGFASESEFKKYTEHFIEGLKNPLIVKY